MVRNALVLNTTSVAGKNGDYYAVDLYSRGEVLLPYFRIFLKSSDKDIYDTFKSNEMKHIDVDLEYRVLGDKVVGFKFNSFA